jgi:hypothetical protein
VPVIDTAVDDDHRYERGTVSTSVSNDLDAAPIATVDAGNGQYERVERCGAVPG